MTHLHPQSSQLLSSSFKDLIWRRRKYVMRIQDKNIGLMTMIVRGALIQLNSHDWYLTFMILCTWMCVGLVIVVIVRHDSTERETRKRVSGSFPQLPPTHNLYTFCTGFASVVRMTVRMKVWIFQMNRHNVYVYVYGQVTQTSSPYRPTTKRGS